MKLKVTQNVRIAIFYLFLAILFVIRFLVLLTIPIHANSQLFARLNLIDVHGFMDYFTILILFCRPVSSFVKHLTICAGDLKFDSRVGLIRHSVVNGTLPL